MKIDGLIFKTEPWPHQLSALKFLMTRDFGGLYTDPGTGKSKVFIDLIVNRGFKRVIISGTKKACEVWEKQFKIHAYSHTICLVNLLNLSGKEKAQQIKQCLTAPPEGLLDRATVVLINYDSIWQKPLGDVLADKFKPDCVIADESHRIKSAGGKWSLYFAKLGRRASHRYILSGSMIAEDPEDAYGQFRFMQPSIFGTNIKNFKAQYHNLDAEASMRTGYPVKDKDNPYKNMEEFYAKFWEHVFRIPSSVKLPKRKNITVEFELYAKGNKAYHMVDKEGAIDTRQGELLIENALSKVIRRQQIASGFIPLTNDNDEVKLYNTDTARIDALEALLEDMPPKEPIVIFAKFSKDLRNIRSVCKKLGRGYSEVSGKEDTEAAWQAGKTSVIGVQYNAGSESIDLTRSRYCIYYSLMHSYTLYSQSKKRIHRPGQNRMCIYYHLLAKTNGKQTIDHKILEALKRKKNLVREIEKGRATL